ncbi:MAG: glutamyl-tRNA reductase [Methanosarcinales archaeon]|nr:MAG: glutamyl-tRNA reductase [Methanosarcinales archaeon]
MAEIASMQITHEWATIDDLEKVRYDDVEAALKELYSFGGVDECVVLQTCNRVEAYIASSGDGEQVLRGYVDYKNISLHIVKYLGHEESLQHLFRLASGLESMIIGEDQILGQVKEAFNSAKSLGTTGKILGMTFRKAINVGKRVRTETGVNKGSVSIGSAAVDLAEQILGTLKHKNVLIIGAGEMATLVAKALSERDISAIVVSSRTHEHALELARELGGKAIHFENFVDYIPVSDVIISATSAPHFVITKEMMEKVVDKLDKKIIIIDIASPRDVEDSVAEIPNVELHNIDSLKSIRDANLEKRKTEALKAKKIIEEELKLFKKQYKQKRADKIISSLYSHIESIRVQERQKALNRLKAAGGLNEQQAKIIDDLTNSLVNKMLAQPTKSLREGSEEEDDDFLHSIMKLFKIGGD